MSRILAFLLGLGLALPAAASPISFDQSWKQQRFSLFAQNKYGFGGQSLTLASNGSVSLTYRSLAPELWSRRAASWSWAVSEGVPATDLRQKGGDDRNLALYFVFLPQAEAQTLRSGNIRRLLRSKDVRVLVYVWGGDHARGSILPSPYLGPRGKTVVLRPSGTGSARERIDLAADYARAFGDKPEALVGLAVSGDSDDTDSRIRASISGLRLE
ncbi:MAG: DUF3047 domain-containing protein [Paracoccaceae bacterium]|nr:DUF3047 domain-containing protein [Paracoccaceae bacterium]